jgi:hypothetical protein
VEQDFGGKATFLLTSAMMIMQPLSSMFQNLSIPTKDIF